MIESGTLQPGIDAADFRLPAGTALRYERPNERLRALLPSYAVMDSDDGYAGPDSWAPPGWAQIWIVLADNPIAVQVRNRRYASLGSAVLWGGSSKAMPVTAQGGVTVVVDISPMGWARLFDRPAEEYRDRITPLDQVWPQGWADELVARVHASDRGRGIKAVLDDFFAERLPPAHRHEAAIARINARLLDPAITESSAIADDLGIHPRTLLRLCARHFGYGPKILLRRTRFLRVLAEMMLMEGEPDFSAVPPGYHDVPHFVRDGTLFLGPTPRRFLAMEMVYLRAILRARRLVLGAPLALLDEGLEAISAETAIEPV